MKDMKKEEEGVRKLCPIFRVYCIAKCTYKGKGKRKCSEIKKSKKFNLAKATSGI